MIRSAFAVAAVLAFAGVVRAEDKAALGQEVKDFALTCACSGKEVKLSDLKGKVVVVNFINYGCPVSRDYDNRFAKFTNDYKDKGVVVLHIDSVNGNTVEVVKEQAEKANLGAPVLKDEGNVIADYFEARVTPHVYVIGKDGKLAYRGSFDDGKGKGFENVTKHYVKDAVDALLAGSEVPVKETKAFGCGIKRVKK